MYDSCETETENLYGGVKKVQCHAQSNKLTIIKSTENSVHTVKI